MKTETMTGNTPGHTQCRLIFEYGSIYKLEEEMPVNDESAIRIATMDRDEPKTTPCERDANAARLVHCWNQHDDLLKQRDALREALKAAINTVECASCDPVTKIELPWYIQARAALALCGKEQGQ